MLSPVGIVSDEYQSESGQIPGESNAMSGSLLMTQVRSRRARVIGKGQK